jgi:hypothetical protein
MAPPDLSTVRPPNTRPVRPTPVLCTRSPTPVTVLVAARHAAPATCTPRDKQTRFSERNKGKRKTKQNYPKFEFKPHQVNDSSQSNQVTVHLVPQSTKNPIPVGGRSRTSPTAIYSTTLRTANTTWWSRSDGEILLVWRVVRYDASTTGRLDLVIDDFKLFRPYGHGELPRWVRVEKLASDGDHALFVSESSLFATVYEEPNPSRWAVPDLADVHLLYHLKDGQHHLVESIGRVNPTRLASGSVRCKHNRPVGPRHRRLQALPAGWTWRTAALGQGGEAHRRRRPGPVRERVVVVRRARVGDVWGAGATASTICPEDEVLRHLSDLEEHKLLFERRFMGAHYTVVLT